MDQEHRERSGKAIPIIMVFELLLSTVHLFGGESMSWQVRPLGYLGNKMEGGGHKQLGFLWWVVSMTPNSLRILPQKPVARKFSATIQIVATTTATGKFSYYNTNSLPQYNFLPQRYRF